MKEINFSIEHIPAVLYGDQSDKIYIYVHGKMGFKEEARSFAQIAVQKGYQVLSVDLPEHGMRKNDKNKFNSWNVVPELKSVLNFAKKKSDNISLYANSIGAWFSMLSFSNEDIQKCLFVSPVLDMEKLIINMMKWADVSEEKLMQEKEIDTTFGETLSWEYLQYARKNRIDNWNVPTSILYAGNDNLTERSVVDNFVKSFNCNLTVMENGEHWFHTPQQLDVLNKWIHNSI